MQSVTALADRERCLMLDSFVFPLPSVFVVFDSLVQNVAQVFEQRNFAPGSRRGNAKLGRFNLFRSNEMSRFNERREYGRHALNVMDISQRSE